MYNYRFDYILIWGHGLKYKNQILDIIRNHKDLRIVKLLYHHPGTIKKLVKTVYSYDYAPFYHLKAKTRYLMNTPNEVFFVFFENQNPDEDYLGEGAFRHIESRTLKVLKEEIRDQFNDRIEGKRTENHVIHVSDNESQTHYMLKYLGYEGISCLKKKASVLDLPYYLNEYKKFVIKEVPIELLICSIVIGNRFEFETKTIPLDESPQYRAIAGDIATYQDYLDVFLGGPLTEDYSVEKYLQLAKQFKYLTQPYQLQYIAVCSFESGKLLVLDGLHRACIMKSRSIKCLPVAILS